VNRYEYHKPGSVEKAVSLITTLEAARYIAGGTDVMVLLKQKKISPKHLVSLRNITGLSFIDASSGLRLGSGVTHADIDANDTIRRHYAALTDATGNLGSCQIRNVATIGGNICNAAPSADTACPLLVLDALVRITGPGGEREIPIDEFFLGPGKTSLEHGELVREFVIPNTGDDTGSAYIKHTRRKAMDLPLLGVATCVTISIGKNGGGLRYKDMAWTAENISSLFAQFEDDGLRCNTAKIAMGVVAPRPVRAKKAEAELAGNVLSERLLDEVGELAASEATPRDSLRGEGWYRKEMVKVLVKRAVMRSIDRVLRPDNMAYPERIY